MTLQTKNLGLVQAIFVGSTPPSNVNMIWRDTSTIPHSFKQWDNTQSQWISLSQNLGNSNLLQSSSLREYTIPDLGELRFKGDAIFAVGLNDENRVGEVRLHSVVQRRTAGVAISGNTSIGVIEEFTPDKMFFETRTELGNSATKKTKLELSLSSLLLEYNGVNTNSINLAEGIQIIRNGFGYKVGSDGTMLMDTTFGAKLRMENIQTLLEHKVDEGGALSMNSIANIFEDRNTVKRGLQYMADYSATLVDFSLTPKIYVDNGLSTKQDTLVSGTNIKTLNGDSLLGSSNLITPRLENANQTIPPATNRTLTIPSDSDLAFVNSLRLKTTGNQSLTQFAQNFTTSVDNAEMQNNSIAPLLDNTTLDLFWKYKNNMGVVSDLFAKVDKSKVYGGKRYTLIKSNGTQEYYDNLTQVRSNWADGDVLHQFADETINWVLSASESMFILPSINWNGNGFKITMQNFTSGQNIGFLISSKIVNIFDLNFDFNINENNTYPFRAVGTSILNLSNVKATQINVVGVGVNTSMLDFANTAILNGDRNTVFASLGTIVMSGGTATVLGYQGASGNIVNGITFNNFRALISLNGSNNIVNSARLTGNSNLTNFTFNQTFNTEAFGSGIFNIQYAKIRVNCATLTSGTVVPNFTDVFFENTSTGLFQTNGCTLINSYFTMNGINFEGSGGLVARGCTFISATGVQNIRENTALVDVQSCTFIANNTTTSGANLLPIGTGFRIVDCILIKNGANGGNIRLGSAVPATINLIGNTYNKGIDYLFSLTAGVAATAKASNVNRLTNSIDYLGQKGVGLSSHFPKMTTTERNALTGVEKGYTIENTTTNFLETYNGSTWKNLLDLT